MVARLRVVLAGALLMACGGQSARFGGEDPGAGAGGVGGNAAAGDAGRAGGTAGVAGGEAAGAFGGNVTGGGAGVPGTGGSAAGLGARCGGAFAPPEPLPPEDVPHSCPNGSVSVIASCSDAPEIGFEGTLDGESLMLAPVVEATVPGTASVSRRACGGGPLTFTFTLALDGERAGDRVTVHANATDACLIQAVYLPKGGAGEPMAVDLTLQVWEQEIGPSVSRGEVVLKGAEGGAAPETLEGTFTLVTVADLCF